MFEGQQYSMPVSCESTSLQVDCSLVLEIVAARQWPNPGQISIALLIGDEVCANNCLSHKLTTKLQVCEKAPTPPKKNIYIKQAHRHTICDQRCRSNGYDKEEYENNDQELVGKLLYLNTFTRPTDRKYLLDPHSWQF